ncbi:MAG: cyclase family protein [Vicinamibacterales bacterium]
MPRIVDLSGPIESGMWGYHELPGLERLLPPVDVTTVASVRSDGFFASRIGMTTISGTYVEAGSHMLEDGPRLDEYPVEAFFQRAAVLRVPTQEPRAVIDAALLARHDPGIREGEALLLDTGWGARWNRPGYVADSPSLRPDALAWIVDRRPSVLGVDVPCIESAWSEEREEDKGRLLQALFRGRTLLVAPLVNLDRIAAARGRLVCLPLALRGTSGAPARVVFLEDDAL